MRYYVGLDVSLKSIPYIFCMRDAPIAEVRRTQKMIPLSLIPLIRTLSSTVG